MNPGHRIGLLVAAAVVLVVAFVLLTGSGDDGASEQTRTAAETTAAQTTPQTTETETETQAGTTPAPAPAPRVEVIRIRSGQPVGEPRTLRFEDGDTIRLRFESNQASEVHIHGYDKYVNVPAGGSERIRFKANAQGVFEVEDHGTAALLAKLEVRP